MLDAKPSATAFAVAGLRALHQLIDTPLVFEDALALCILGERGRNKLADAAEAPHRLTRLRASVVARSRIAEDVLAEAAAAGVRQYVLLGAGLDTRGCRGAVDEPDMTVFEVDHPATQAWKRGLLAEAGLQPPPTQHFVPHDFARQDLHGSLAEAGFAFDRPAVWAMLGVTVYVERPALLETFALIGGLGPGMATLVFDYPEDWTSAPPAVRAAYQALADRAAAAGEPWRTTFAPGELARELRPLGFRDIVDENSAALTARLFAGRTDGLHPGPLSHVVTARA